MNFRETKYAMVGLCVLILIHPIVGQCDETKPTWWQRVKSGARSRGERILNWWDSKEKVLSDQQNVENVVENPVDPLTCVDLYYKAVLDGNHRQYQCCVVTPLTIEEFMRRVEIRRHEITRRGIVRMDAPVRARTGSGDLRDDVSVKVFSFSPWTDGECVFHVIRYGQGWKIKEDGTCGFQTF